MTPWRFSSSETLVRLGSTLGLGVLLAVSGCSVMHRGSTKGVPESLVVPDVQRLTIAAHGTGVQIYECGPSKADPAAFVWTLKAPEAQLRYLGGKDLGKHYAGPTWEANDGSKVIGELTAQDAGPDPKAIPWLLLRATRTLGDGVFSGVRSIQRLHTVGGKAPLTGCGAEYVGTEVRVAYSADYYFYVERP